MSDLNFTLYPCEKWDGEKWIPWHLAVRTPKRNNETEEGCND